jgi:hypothetical protein
VAANISCTAADWRNGTVFQLTGIACDQSCYLYRTTSHENVKCILSQIFSEYKRLVRGRNSSVGVAPRYGLDGRGIESR